MCAHRIQDARCLASDINDVQTPRILAATTALLMLIAAHSAYAQDGDWDTTANEIRVDTCEELANALSVLMTPGPPPGSYAGEWTIFIDADLECTEEIEVYFQEDTPCRVNIVSGDKTEHRTITSSASTRLFYIHDIFSGHSQGGGPFGGQSRRSHCSDDNDGAGNRPIFNLERIRLQGPALDHWPGEGNPGKQEVPNMPIGGGVELHEISFEATDCIFEGFNTGHVYITPMDNCGNYEENNRYQTQQSNYDGHDGHYAPVSGAAVFMTRGIHRITNCQFEKNISVFRCDDCSIDEVGDDEASCWNFNNPPGTNCTEINRLGEKNDENNSTGPAHGGAICHLVVNVSNNNNPTVLEDCAQGVSVEGDSANGFLVCRSIFRNNVTFGNGGAIHSKAGAFRVDQCVFEENQAFGLHVSDSYAYGGGAIYRTDGENDPGAQTRITCSTFDGNIAGGYDEDFYDDNTVCSTSVLIQNGGAVFLNEVSSLEDPPSGNIRYCEFINNVTEDDAIGSSVMLHGEDSQALVERSTFTTNSDYVDNNGEFDPCVRAIGVNADSGQCDGGWREIFGDCNDLDLEREGGKYLPPDDLNEVHECQFDGPSAGFYVKHRKLLVTNCNVNRPEECGPVFVVDSTGCTQNTSHVTYYGGAAFCFDSRIIVLPGEEGDRANLSCPVDFMPVVSANDVLNSGILFQGNFFDPDWDPACNSTLPYVCIDTANNAPYPQSTGSCNADLSGNGLVDGADLATVLGNWGPNHQGDLNGDGLTNGADLALVLAAWGACWSECPN